MSAKLKLGISAVACVVLLAVGLGVGFGLGRSSSGGPDESPSAANTRLADFASTSDRLDCRRRKLTGKASKECDETFAITLQDLCDLPARRLASTRGQSKPRRSLGTENTLRPSEQGAGRCTCAPTSAVTPRPTFAIEIDTLVPTSGSTPTVSTDATAPPTLSLQTVAPIEAVALVCPPPDLVGCTSPDPSNPVDECDAEGAPCDAVPGGSCCRDSCRLYCTAKGAAAAGGGTGGEPRRRRRRRLGTEATTPPEPTYAPTLPPVTLVPTPAPTYVPTICSDSADVATPFPTLAPVLDVKPIPSVPPTVSSGCPPCPEEVVTPRPTPQPVTPFPTTDFPTIPVPTDGPTDLPTSGSTPTVSTEATGPPTAPAREPKA